MTLDAWRAAGNELRFDGRPVFYASDGQGRARDDMHGGKLGARFVPIPPGREVVLAVAKLAREHVVDVDAELK